jgi:CheY-like chemotaxis protein/HPt (histidine-containing phosphotransfer) domain-containing protein
MVRGDPGRLSQVLTNLLGNAIKFTEQGEVILRVSRGGDRENEAANRAVVRFEVRDTGVGITAEQQSRLFESFTQADASTTRRFGGTGLGLAISRQLVDLLGGRIAVQSQPGSGSTFWFEIPFQNLPDDSTVLPTPQADLAGLRALVVDDNKTNREIVHGQVTSWGLTSGKAEDGEQALGMLRDAAVDGKPYDVVILDMQMPGMDGRELARRIKADPAISSAKLILLTSFAGRGDGAEARRAGIQAYLTKPVRQSQLYDAIVTLIARPEEPGLEDTHLITRHSISERRAARRARVLIAEDNPVNQKVAVRMLETLGYRADVAANGIEAIEALSRVPYAAVLMDVQMPQMDGFQATAEIRRRESIEEKERGDNFSRTPIIALTANAIKGDHETALRAGMDDYIAKPVNREQLEMVLARWVRDEASPVLSESPTDPLDRKAIEQLRELGGDELLLELTQMFVDKAATDLTSLKGLVEEGDAHSVERVAHALQGSAGNMGAMKMASICSELQDAGASEDLTSAPALLQRLEAEFERVRSALYSDLEAD